MIYLSSLFLRCILIASFHTQKKMGSARFYRISYKSAKNGHDAKRDKGYYGQIQNIIQQLWHDVFFFQKSDLNEYIVLICQNSTY